MHVKFESDFQKKILHISFPPSTKLNTVQDLEAWKKEWMQELKSWHSPYKALIDASNLSMENGSEDFVKALNKNFEFFKRFFLRKTVAWGLKQTPISPDQLPFESFETEEEALKAIGLRESLRKAGDDFRSLIHIDNHFEQKNVELSFLEPVVLSKDKLAILRSKLTNNLMQWHSHWQLLIDCSSLEVPQESFEDFDKMTRFLNGFFLEKVVGYAPRSKDLSYPFPVYRSRHKAAAHVKSSGTDSGRDAHCRK